MLSVAEASIRATLPTESAIAGVSLARRFDAAA
jgi:hypothetical protein